MKAFEVLALAKPMIEKLMSVGVSPKDVQYLEVYSEYTRLKNEGHKIVWIVYILSDEYEMSERQIYSIIKKFSTDI